MQPEDLQTSGMEYFHCLVLWTLLISVACREIPEDGPQETPRNSTPCSIDPNRVCSAIEVSENYSMQLDTRHFHEYGEIGVRVYKTVCELSGAKSPWWYQLDVREKQASAGSGDGIPDSTESSIGQFRRPQQAYELQLCKQDSAVVFSSCSPIPLDLPRQFIWKATIAYSNKDSICFRLTLQLSGDRSCRQKEVCVSIGDIPVSSPDSGGGSGVFHYDFSEVESEHGFSRLASTAEADEDMLAMEEEEMLMEIIEETFQDDVEEVIVPAERGCLVAHAFFTENQLPWVPDCDCEGYYKSVQCVDNGDGLQCWCSTPSGSEIHNSRKTLNCTDPKSFEFRC